MKGLVVLIASMVLLCACANTADILNSEKASLAKAPFPQLDNSFFTPLEVEDTQDIFTLSDSQKQAFLEYFYAEQNSHIPGHKRLFNYLDGKLANFDYLGQTYVASTALSEDAGNCLSLAILTTALADTVGLDVGYQMVLTKPIYNRYHNLLTTSNHVRTVIYAPRPENLADNEVVFVRARIIVDYFKQRGNVVSQYITKNDFIAMYYQNQASTAIIRQDYDLAYSYLNQAIKLNPYNPSSVNALAVLYKKVGHLENMRTVFEFGLDHTERSVNMVSNYADFLISNGNQTRAEQILQDIDLNLDQNPYTWLDLGQQQFAKGDIKLATRYFKKSVALAPYLHEGYFALAKLYKHQQQPRKAYKALQTAYSLSPDGQLRNLYAAKAEILSQYID